MGWLFFSYLLVGVALTLRWIGNIAPPRATFMDLVQ